MPITPANAMKTKRLMIPEEVFAAFDELITQEIDISGCAVIKQSAAIDLVCVKLGIPEDAVERRRNGEEVLTRDDVYKNGWMDVEESYPTSRVGGCVRPPCVLRIVRTNVHI